MPVTISGTTGISIDGDPVATGTDLAILQVVSTTKTDTFSTNSATFVDLTGLELTITPTSATSKVLLVVTLNASSSGRPRPVVLRLDRNGTAIGVADAAGSRGLAGWGIGLGDSSGAGVGRMNFSGAYNYLDSPATTSAAVYKVQVASAEPATSIVINRTDTDTDTSGLLYARTVSTITAFEVAA